MGQRVSTQRYGAQRDSAPHREINGAQSDSAPPHVIYGAQRDCAPHREIYGARRDSVPPHVIYGAEVSAPHEGGGAAH